MARQTEQHIAVMPDTLSNLMAAVANGDYRIPQFQREFVWKKPKTIELFDSIYREFPIGSFFLWKAGRDNNRLFRHVVGLDVPPAGKHDDISFILDGQQRITSLYVTLKGLTVNEVDYSKIVFDLQDEKFGHREPDNRRYVAVCEIWGSNAMTISRQLDPKFQPAFDQCWKRLQTYPVSLVEVRDKDLPAVCKIFQRINQGGQRLDRFDLIAAMTFTPTFDIRQKFKSDVIALLEEKHFGKIAPAVMTQLMALLKDGQCTERHEFSLTATDIEGLWNNSVDAVLLAADTLRKNMGVMNSGYLPYAPMLTLLAYYFVKSGKRSLSASHLAWVRHWFWRSCFGLRYGSGGPTRMGQDKILFDKLIAGNEPQLDVSVRVSVPGPEEEITERNVHDRYLVGVLAPRVQAGGPAAPAQQPDEEDEEIPANPL